MKKRMYQFIAVFSASVLMLSFISVLPAYASFNKNLLISDTIFDSQNAMTATQIDNFLNGFPRSCISPNSGFRAILPSGYNPSSGFSFGGFTTAGSVIYTAAQVYNINPRVLVVTLEKEQSLVTGRNVTTYCNDGDQHKYAAAMGYGCPDSGTSHSYTGLNLYRRNGVTYSATGTTCVNSAAKAGFSQQVIRAAWLLKFGQQRSKGNINWAIVEGNWDNSDDPQSCYSGPMTKGTWQVCPSGSSVFYDGFRTIDGSSTFMGSGGTAALYWYTPHFHGNQNFVTLYENWFGSTTSPCLTETNVAGQPSGRTIIPNKQRKGAAETLAFTRLNNTGSKCTESHVWNNGYRSWASNNVTSLPSVDPDNKEIITGDMNGDGKDELMFVKYQSGSGFVEVHTWDASLKAWVSNVKTNLTNKDPTNTAVFAADMNGDGKDELMFVKYQSGSGFVEVHTWNPGYKTWASNAATGLPNIQTPSNTLIIAADTNGNGKDELMFVKYQSGSGFVEVHTWNPGYKTWASHQLTNLENVATPSNVTIMGGDTNGNGKDELMFVKYQSGSGFVEVHTWNPGYKTWASHQLTNLTAFNPSL